MERIGHKKGIPVKSDKKDLTPGPSPEIETKRSFVSISGEGSRRGRMFLHPLS
jgi:hypothetical protein